MVNLGSVNNQKTVMSLFERFDEDSRVLLVMLFYVQCKLF